MIIFIVPKNARLKICGEALQKGELIGKIVAVRGEDVPLVVSKLLKENKTTVGITGEDLFREFSLKNKNSGLKIQERIEWKDDSCIFKKPTLCLLGPKDKRFEDLPKQLRICINSKYKEIAKKGCTNLLENKGYRIEKLYASGATEEFFSNNIVDLVIEIVCSGKSAEEAGLKVYDKIFSSDIVIIGGKNDNSFN